MILLMVSAITGGISTGIALYPYGWMGVLIGAPIGGSVFAGMMAGVLYFRRAADADGLSSFGPSPAVSAASGFHPSRGE